MWFRNSFVVLLIGIMTSSAILLPDQLTQTNQAVMITSPSHGEILSGVVDIFGSTIIDGFVKTELAFSNAIDPKNTWFLISKSINYIESGLLATWDTTLITDGDYQLRLRVFGNDNSISDFMVTSITIRNYTPVVTITPSTVYVGDPTATKLIATVTLEVTPTLLPENPLELSSRKFSLSIIYGILATLCLVIFLNICFKWLKK